MARDPRLALAEHLGELGHGPFALAAEDQETQPAGLGGSAQAVQEGLEAVVLVGHGGSRRNPGGAGIEDMHI